MEEFEKQIEKDYKESGSNSYFGNGWIKGYNYAMKWIPIEEELPNDFTSVLVRNKANDIRSVALYQDNKFYPDFKAIEHKDVTHWRKI